MTSAAELRISEPLRGFIKHQSNRAYIDGGQAKWLTDIADKIDAKHEQAITATLRGEREKALEELVRDMRRDLVAAYHIAGIATELPTPFDRRIRKLGIEVD